jgi:hypothetical protein
MKLLIVGTVDPWTRSVASIQEYAKAAGKLGHEVAVYGPPNPDLAGVPFTTDLVGIDVALFVLQVTWDLPEMPDLARLLDAIPPERRVVLDLWGRYNDTIRLEHDFNHLEKVDGHPGVEWVEAIEAISDTVLQPTLAPLRSDVRSFLFHGFNADMVAKKHASAKDAAQAWLEAGPAERPYGMVYVGSNWHRWDQLRRLLEQHRTVRNEVGHARLTGWDWMQRPDWAVEGAIEGINTDPTLLAELGVVVSDGIRFDEVVPLLSKARFAPVIHRPLFRKLGIVTNRTFETFYADALPMLMLPRDFVAEIYGPAALDLVPGDDVAAFMTDALQRPEHYWQAVLATREHLARNHSYQQRFMEFEALVGQETATGAVG